MVEFNGWYPSLKWNIATKRYSVSPSLGVETTISSFSTESIYVSPSSYPVLRFSPPNLVTCTFKYPYPSNNRYISLPAPYTMVITFEMLSQDIDPYWYPSWNIMIESQEPIVGNTLDLDYLLTGYILINYLLL